MKRRAFITNAGKSVAAAAVLNHLPAFALGAMPSTVADNVVTYPNPPIPPAAEFVVLANDIPVYVCNAGTFRTSTFAFSGKVTIQVIYKGKIHSYAINPTSKGIKASQSGNTLTFTLLSPQKLEIQINGASSQITDNDKLLYLFADAIETDAPAANDPDIYYVGPGHHTVPGNSIEFSPKDNYKGLYLAPGALLEAVVSVSHKSNFKISGRGFIRNPFTDKSRSMLNVTNSTDVTIKDIHLYDSIQHVMGFGSGQDKKGHDITVTNVKSMHYIVNSDGVTLFGPVSNVTIDDCFIIGNDNLIVLGGAGGSEPLGPFNNTIRNCTFIKSSYAGNWFFPQGNSRPNSGGNIGPNNFIIDCDIIRMNGERGLITEWWGDPTAIENVVLDNIRVQSFRGYEPNPSKSSTNRLLCLLSTDKIHKKELTLRNMRLPSAQTSEIADGLWVINFDHVFVNDKPVKSDADLSLTKGKSVVTNYIY
jgi:hypothetical protein